MDILPKKEKRLAYFCVGLLSSIFDLINIELETIHHACHGVVYQHDQEAFWRARPGHGMISFLSLLRIIF